MEEPQLAQLRALGKVKGPSADLFRITAAHSIASAIEQEAPPLKERLRVLALLDGFLNQSGDELFAPERMSLKDLDPGAEIEKWNSGFTPIDVVIGGLYQSLLVLMGRPGSGKTSLMVTFAEQIKRTLGWRILFFEQEIPSKLMAARLSPVVQRGNPFGDGDELVTGGATMDDIVEMASTCQDGNQVIFIDYPDLMASSGDNRRNDIEDLYKVMVRLKKISRMIIVASQPRRKDSVLSQASVADAWAKAWYADCIVGIQPVGRGKLRLKGLKNRFGPPENEVTFNYNLADLTYEEPVPVEEEDW